MTITSESLELPSASSLIGTWRRFGPTGPVYEIIGTAERQASNERVFRVRVVETGEEIEYRLAEILDDPRER